MKKILLILIINSIIIISGCANTQFTGCTDIAKICPDGTHVGRNPDNNCEFDPCPECPEGYVLSQYPWPMPPGKEPSSYCRINKEWEEFETCEKKEDCPEEYSCLAKLDTADFRCVPLKNYPMECACVPEGGCWCT